MNHRLRKNSEQGSALFFALLVLVLIGGFTAAMLDISVSTAKLNRSLVDVSSTKYFAEIGVGYVLQKVNSNSLQGKEGDTISQLTSEVGQIHNVGSSSDPNRGWFQITEVEPFGNNHYRVKIQGGTFDSFSSTPSPVTATYELVIGPKTLGDAGTNPFGGTLPANPWNFGGNPPYFKAYPGGTGRILFQDPNSSGFPTSALGPRMSIGQLAPNLDIAAIEAQKVSDVRAAILSKINWNTNTFADPTVEASVMANPVSPPSGSASWGNGSYLLTSGLTINGSANVQIGDSTAPTYLRVGSGDLKVGGNATLQLGAGQYMLTGHKNFELRGNSYTTIGDPTGNQFTYFLADDLIVEGNAVLVLGPGIYSFSRIKLKENAKVILDTTHGPVYFLANGMLHKAKFEMKGNATLVNFKDTSVDTSTYALATDQANAGNPVGPNGQKVASIFMDAQTKPLDVFAIEGHALFGAFAKGSQTNIWNPATFSWADLAGTGSELNSSGILKTDRPTAGAVQVWGKSLPELTLGGNAIATGSFMFTSIKEVELKGNSALYGALGFGSLTEEFEMKGNAKMYTDPNINPYPPQPIKGSYHVKWLRKVQ